MNMVERIAYHNPDHVKHLGWVDKEGKAWDVPERLMPVIEAFLNDSSKKTEWNILTEYHPETLELITKVHSAEMIEAIAQASLDATNENPVKTVFDKDIYTYASAVYPGTYEQALMSAECAVSAADTLISGRTNLAISISRPPGHHSGRDFHHGFCYFNPAAIAAEALKEEAERVAILDFDVHHGDGTQDIFYNDPRVMCTSIHADPDIIMPHTGYLDETGGELASGTVINRPFPIGVDTVTYLELLDDICNQIEEFSPNYLIIEAGFDGHRDEYTNLPPLTQLGDYEYRKIGERISRIGIPMLVIFGGGYNQSVTASAFESFLEGVNDNKLTQDAELFTQEDLLPGEQLNT